MKRKIVLLIVLILLAGCGAWLVLYSGLVDDLFNALAPAPTPAPAASGGDVAVANNGGLHSGATDKVENTAPPAPPEIPIGVNQQKIVDLARLEYANWPDIAPDHSKYGPNGEWCGDFAAWVLNTATGIPKPASYGLADAWRNVSGNLSYHEGRDGLEPGDFVLYDVDTSNNISSSGGIHNGTANHINIYVGDGKVIGGNQSGALTERDLDDYLVNLTPNLEKTDPKYADFTYYVLGYIRVSD